jgi:tetratricopeptide (TPR) repeat protein
MMIESQGPKVPNVTLVASFTNVTFKLRCSEPEMSLMANTPNHRAISKVRYRSQIHRAFALMVVVGLSVPNSSSSLYAQFTNGDAPASPWSNSAKSPTAERDRTRPTDLVRQPSSNQVGSMEPQMRSMEPVGEVSSRPAAVTMFGPQAPKKNNKSLLSSERTSNDRGNFERTNNDRTNERNNSDRSFEAPSNDPEFPKDPTARSLPRMKTYPAAASPSHALTQKTPNEAQSDWHRVPAGGLILEEFSPDVVIDYRSTRNPSASEFSTRRGLPDRVDDTRNAQAPAPKMASSSAADRYDLFQPRPNPVNPASEKSQNQGLPSTACDIPRLADGFELEMQSRNHTPAPTPSVTSEQADAPSPTLAIQKSQHAHAPSIPAYESTVREVSMNPVANSPVANSESNASDVIKRNDAPIVDESQMKRIALAQRVSHEILSQPQYPAARAPEILESPPGWQSVEQELKIHLERCDSLLKRGAVHSAREEAVQGLRRLFRTMDVYRRNCVSEPALDKALAALKEEADFQHVVGGSKQAAIASIVASHSTEALKSRPLESVSPEIASQHYRMFARYQFIVAADGHQWASDLLYAYGKTLEKEAEQDAARAIMLRSQSVVCYQAATQVAPGQSDAANQLGYALIHLDRIDEAYQALTASLQYKPTANAWNNLAELFRRRGAMSEAEYAVQQASALSDAQSQYSYDSPQITEVDPAVFAKYSPMPNVGTPAPVGNANPSSPKIFRL